VSEFSLETAIADWRRQLRAEGMQDEVLRELEDHLRSSIERAVDAGQPLAVSFVRACEQMGESTLLAQEFTKESTMKSFSKLSGVAIAVLAMVVVMELEGMHTVVLCAWPPLLFVLGVSLGGLVAGHGPVRVWRAFAVALLGAEVTAGQVEPLRDICRRGQRLAYMGGFLQLILGAMHLMSVLDAPHLIGPGIAYAMIGLVHAALIAELGFASMERWMVGSQPFAERTA
jgi:hypothetical protein